jgi:hypothetical protein
MLKRAFIVSWLLLVAATAGAQVPAPQALVEAKTIFLTLDRESEMKDLDEIAKELGKWGRFQLVDSPEKAPSSCALRSDRESAPSGWSPNLRKSRRPWATHSCSPRNRASWTSVTFVLTWG